MLKFLGFAVLMFCFSGATLAQEGFKLAPGERLVSVDGVPVAGTSQGSGTSKGVPTSSSPAKVQAAGCANGACNAGSTVATVSSRGSTAIIGEGTAAYQHALREAQIIASRGGSYHRHGDGGHPLGTAPGCKYSGTGYTWDMNRPGHCWEDELPESRIVARARAQGVNGAWFWSAHYR
jgi:hypothetical protein